MRQTWLIPTFLLIASCGNTAKLAVEEAQVRLPAVPGNPGAAYFTLKGGPTADRLMSVTSPVVIRAEMHDSVMKNGVMTMSPIDSGVEVAAGSTVKFAPRGKHVMLYDIEPKSQAAETMTLSFTFASGLILTAPANVMKAGEGHAH